MSQWTSKYAILRDLSEAQGRRVPVDIVEAVGDGDIPPTPNVVEETEEEFFENCIGAGDAPVPDFGLIRQMLYDVQLSTTPVDKNEETKPHNCEFTLQINVTGEIGNTRRTVQRINGTRKCRNIAVESILQAIDQEIVNENGVTKNPVLKTDHSTIIDNNASGKNMTISNVNADSVISKHVSPTNTMVLAIEPMNMFRKKGPSKKITKEETKPSMAKNNNKETYKPSELAGEYYKKYLERTRLREAMQVDIWTKAEKKMKEIEAMKQMQAEQSSSEDRETEVGKNWDEIRLPQHRHLLNGECIVCKAMSLRGYHINMTE